MKKLNFSCIILTLSQTIITAQVGVNTSTPQRSLHVNGSLQIVNELNVGGNSSTAGSSGSSGQVLKSSGPGQAPVWSSIAGVPNSTGTVIAVNGQFLVAQEITVQMTTDHAGIGVVGQLIPDRIKNLNNEIVDNENAYIGNSTGNSFKVTMDGVYQVIMNMQLSASGSSTPVIGIWDDTLNKWVARVNDTYIAPARGKQTLTLITSIPMLSNHTYSFRSSNTVNYAIFQANSDSTGSGPVSQVTLKRLK